MRESELHAQLGALAERLDDTAPPIDVEAILTAPRRPGAGRRGLYTVAAVAAVTVLLAAIGLTRPDPADEPREPVVTDSPAQIEIVGPIESLVDGQQLTIAGHGFPPDAEVTVRQCSPTGCDDWRAPMPVTVDGDGRFSVPLVAYRDIATGRGTEPGDPVAPDWSACDPCELRATATAGPEGAATARAAAALPTPVAPTAGSLHPTVRITTPGPHRAGQQVQVEGSGFQPDPDGLGISIAYCPAGARRAEECGGGPDLGNFGIGADGRFTIAAFELPPVDANLGGTRCTDEPGTCVITWFLTTPGPLPAGTPLDLTP